VAADVPPAVVAGPIKAKKPRAAATCQTCKQKGQVGVPKKGHTCPYAAASASDAVVPASTNKKGRTTLHKQFTDFVYKSKETDPLAHIAFKEAWFESLEAQSEAVRHDPAQLAEWQAKFMGDHHDTVVKPALQAFGQTFGNLLVGPESDAAAVEAVEASVLCGSDGEEGVDALETSGAPTNERLVATEGEVDDGAGA
jgi:hypothetical protein